MSRKAKTAVNLDTISKRYDFTVSLQNDTVLATPGKQLVIEGTNSNSIDEPLGMVRSLPLPCDYLIFLRLTLSTIIIVLFCST